MSWPDFDKSCMQCHQDHRKGKCQHFCQQEEWLSDLLSPAGNQVVPSIKADVTGVEVLFEYCHILQSTHYHLTALSYNIWYMVFLYPEPQHIYHFLPENGGSALRIELFAQDIWRVSSLWLLTSKPWHVCSLLPHWTPCSRMWSTWHLEGTKLK